MEAAGVSVMELGGYITEQFQKAVADPQDNLLGDLATACATGVLDDVAALTMMVTLFSAGGESTASLIGSAAWILATHPDVQQQVRQHPDLVGGFLEEVLRYEPPFRGHYRHVLNDTELCGVQLPAGSRLLLLWGAANRDPLQFDNPGQFRLDRPMAKSHITFGKGIHFCVGAALARLEANVVLSRLLELHLERASRRDRAMATEPSSAPARTSAPCIGVNPFAQLHLRGVTPFLVQHLSSVAQDYRNGIFAGVNNLVEVVTGSKAMTAEEVAIADPSRFAEPELAQAQSAARRRTRR